MIHRRRGGAISGGRLPLTYISPIVRLVALAPSSLRLVNWPAKVCEVPFIYKVLVPQLNVVPEFEKAPFTYTFVASVTVPEAMVNPPNCRLVPALFVIVELEPLNVTV